MPASSIQNLMNNRDAIRKLMAMDANGQMSQILKEAKNNGSFVENADGGTYTPKQTQQPQAPQIIVNEQVMAGHKRMPKKILESFRDNPIQEPSMSNSVLAGLDIPPIQQQTKNIQESTQAQQSMPVGNIDYSLIKTIINEAVQENVKKYVSAMYKKLVNESKGSNTLEAVKLGESQISFIDSNGNIYAAPLKFKRNISQVND